MPTYDSIDFQPPAPVAIVTVHSAAIGRSVPDVPVLLDSGADVSLLPRKLLVDLVGPTDGLQQYELEAFDGSKSLVSAV